MSLLPLERLLPIRDEIQFLQRCCQVLSELGAAEAMYRAVVNSIEIIGEATNNRRLKWKSPADVVLAGLFLVVWL
ncbi:ribonuclease HepT family protein [Hymenobacter baengnokdamensis]|uniref:hypothetical protein n=1 Tax=Hymenobacter baengnokdamensis TaxID=2615203 RepID=UPI001248CFBF|nr:hypothetical protein [Hymenobacter baengnokdamensis]